MIRFELKRLASNSLVYGVGAMLQRFMGLLLLPFFTQVLTPVDYGVIALISLVAVASAGLFNLGTGNSMGLLYFREEDKSKRPGIIWSNVMLLIFNSLLFLVILLFMAPWISQLIFETDRYAELLRLAFIGLALMTITEPFLAYLRMEEKAKAYVILTLSHAFLTIILSAWLVLGLSKGVLGIMLAGVISNAVMCLVVLCMVGRQLPFSMNSTLFKPLIRIGFPSIFGLFAFLLIDYADRQMLQRLVGLDDLGVYSVGYSFGMVMMIFVGAFSAAWPPFYSSFVNRLEDAKVVFAKVFKYYVLVFGLLVMMFFIFAKPIVVFMAASPFQDAFLVVGMVAAAYMLKGCYLIFLPGICFAHKLHLQSGIEWAAALVNIALNFLWIPEYGITGAAGATLVSYLILTTLSWLVSKHYLVVAYDWKGIVPAVTVMAVSCMLLYYMPAFDAFIFSALYSLLLVCSVIVFITFYILNDVERNMLYNKTIGLIKK